MTCSKRTSLLSNSKEALLLKTISDYSSEVKSGSVTTTSFKLNTD